MNFSTIIDLPDLKEVKVYFNTAEGVIFRCASYGDSHDRWAVMVKLPYAVGGRFGDRFVVETANLLSKADAFGRVLQLCERYGEELAAFAKVYACIKGAMDSGDCEKIRRSVGSLENAWRQQRWYTPAGHFKPDEIRYAMLQKYGAFVL